MTSATSTIIMATLKSDPSVTAAQLKTVMVTLSGGSPAADRPRIISFEDAAARANGSKRMIHRLVQSGALAGVKLPGRKRCKGVLESDFERMIVQVAQ
jgi:hypothetical protein